MESTSAIAPNRVIHHRDVPPLLRGDDPFSPEDDGFDRKRVEYVRSRWHSQDRLLRDRDRQIELNIRMLAGQQWSIWSALMGRWVDLRDFMKDEERRWRHMPVINRLMHWFMLLHARLTENPPVVTFQPDSGDRHDALLAETMDTVWKHLYTEMNMSERLDELFAWLIPCGAAYLRTRIDPFLGDAKPLMGDAQLQLLDASGNPAVGMDGQPITRQTSGVPFDQNGEPLAKLDEEGNVQTSGDPHMLYDGGFAMDVLPSIQVRGSWGPTPWNAKHWHCTRCLMTPEEVWNTFGLEVEPTIIGSEAEEANVFRRVLLGSGFYGAATGKQLFDSGGGDAMQGYVEVLEYWERPSRLPGTEKTEQSPGGRQTVIAGDKRVRDGVRFAPFPYTSPIREFKFVNMPGRASGTSPQEMMNGPQKTFNRIASQILQHVTLVANPIQLIDEQSIGEDQITNRPGSQVYANLQGLTQPPLQFVGPGNLPGDVWRIQAQLREELNELGNVSGAEGTPPTADSSGELVKELRFNSDRFVGPTLRRAVQEISRMAEDWAVMIPHVWDEQRVLQVAGEDFVGTTIMVMPDMFETGSFNVTPDVESMLPEGRGERQVRIRRMYGDGIFGPPGTPEAISAFLDMSRFPHMRRTARPGGIDRVTAEQNVGKLLQGAQSAELPLFEWYDLGVHLQVTEKFMKGPEYLKLEVVTQQQFATHRFTIKLAQLAVAQEEIAQEAALQMDTARASVLTAGAGQAQAQALGMKTQGEIEAEERAKERQQASA